MSDDRLLHPETNGHDTAEPVTLTTIETAIERIGVRYIDDLRTLSEKFSRYYEVELSAKDKQIAELNRRVHEVERERAILAEQVRELKRSSAEYLANLQQLNIELSRQLEVSDQESGTPTAGS